MSVTACKLNMEYDVMYAKKKPNGNYPLADRERNKAKYYKI